ncbi:MAG: ATP-binding cassette domain-containing protein [Spirochaetaceae bacterium]|jgi:molybdate transport system ATP-binding protein|nr:ATP-binding cassette domain-containing protein [Spirochaetaceae bacterium]
MSLRVAIRKRLSRAFTLETEFETHDGVHADNVPGGDAPEGGAGVRKEETPQCLGILGASGSGKSMTLKCIAGIERPDEGRIELNGRVLFDSEKKISLKPRERRVGYLFQNYALFPRSRVLENITMGLPLPREERKRRGREWIARFGLSGFEDRYPSQLSGGQQQRTALARMLIREPELVLLDEPFSALDSALREQMQLYLAELLALRSDVILVTHSRDEAYKLCAEILVLEDGRILGRGKTGELFRNPGSVGIARLTGCKNISRAQKTGEYELKALDWGLTLGTAFPVSPEITHVGIRAHDFRPDAPAGAPNRVRIKLTRRLEEPFEEAVLFTNADAEGAEEQGEIWWKFSKYSKPGIPEYLCIPPECLLPLGG